jgi:hypothetical protein
MDFTVRTRPAWLASPRIPAFRVCACGLTCRQSERIQWLMQHADLARTLLRGPRSNVYHLYPSLNLSLRLLQPVRDAALRRAALGLLLQQPV